MYRKRTLESNVYPQIEHQSTRVILKLCADTKLSVKYTFSEYEESRVIISLYTRNLQKKCLVLRTKRYNCLLSFLTYDQ